MAPILVFSGLAIAASGAVAVMVGKSMECCSCHQEAESHESVHARIDESDGNSSAVRFHKSDGESFFATQ